MTAVINTDLCFSDIQSYTTVDEFPSSGPASTSIILFYDETSKILYKVNYGEIITAGVVAYTYTVVGHTISSVYLEVPEEYKDLYQRILYLLVEYGEDLIKDCKSTCKDRNVNVMDCYNMFLSLLAARKLYEETDLPKYIKLAAVIKEHIEYKLNYYFNN